jgi:hypothetical protein
MSAFIDWCGTLKDTRDVSDPRRPSIQNGRKRFANTVRFNRKARRLRVTDGLTALGMFQEIPRTL